mmetsp:Transcript_12168/g.21081  ORF Transcript_12168/g.21081 Transcript_12168/m.21081 type:complete len:432 (+) Transcript_12168:64-1359(+)
MILLQHHTQINHGIIMAVKTRKSSAKKSKPSKAAAPSVSKRSNIHGIKSNDTNAPSSCSNNRIDEGDASELSDAAEHQSILISKREVEYSERTWWMVDIEHSDASGEDGNAINQGATPLVKRCMRVYNWTLPKTRKVLTAYRQFLSLKKDYQDWDATILSPSHLVDQMWHQHILDVVNYAHDMMLLCGRVVGHNPDGAMCGKAERDATTREALERRFPKFDREIWGVGTEEDILEHGDGQIIAIEERGGISSTNKPKSSYVDNGEPMNIDYVRVKFIDDESKRGRYLSINRKVPMTAIFNIIASGKGVGVSKLAFFLYSKRDGWIGRRIKVGDIPALLELENGDEIRVFPNYELTIIFKAQNSEETHFKLKRTTKLKKVFAAYASRKGVDVEDLKFFLDGERIGDVHIATPISLELIDYDQIHVVPVQRGY